MAVKRTMPTRTLLQGAPYIPAAATDIRKTFERARAELQPKPANVRALRKSKS